MNPILSNKPDRPPAASSVSWVFGLAGASFLMALMIVGLSNTAQTKAIKISVKPDVAQGRILYEGEGCIECHSRMVGPFDRGMGPQASEALLISETSETIGTSRIGPDLQNMAGKYPDDLLRIRLTSPQGLQPGTIMPNYSHLGPSEISALVSYLQTPLTITSKWEKVRETNRIEPAVPDSVLETLAQFFDSETGIFNPPMQDTPELQIAARGIYTSRCAACHGLEGHGDGPVSWANPSGQKPDKRSVSPISPADFTSETYKDYSPAMWYWRITGGVPGSGMP